MRIKWHGHASFELESDEGVVHIDPKEFRGEAKPADLVLITHVHESHFDLEGLQKVSGPGTMLAGPRNVVEEVCNVNTVRAVSPGDFLDHHGIFVQAVHAFHPEGYYHGEGEGLGYVIEVEGKRVYHAGDTGIQHNMHFLEDIGVALVPIGGLYNLSLYEAVEATKLINPEIVVPMHYGRLDYYPADPVRFKQLVEDETSTRVEILEENELYY